MSKDKKQNLNEQEFVPDFGADNNGIQYSCGHINPLQKALTVNGKEQMKTIVRGLKTALNGLEKYNQEILKFATTRLEEVRSINIELRSHTTSECSCLDDYECQSCEEYRDEIRDLQNDLDFIKEKEEELFAKNTELEEKIIILQEKYDYLKQLVDSL